MRLSQLAAGLSIVPQDLRGADPDITGLSEDSREESVQQELLHEQAPRRTD